MRSEAPAWAKAAGNSYPLRLPPPRQSSTLPPSRKRPVLARQPQEARRRLESEPRPAVPPHHRPAGPLRRRQQPPHQRRHEEEGARRHVPQSRRQVGPQPRTRQRPRLPLRRRRPRRALRHLRTPGANAGTVFVGRTADTPAFAVDCIEKWWRTEGRKRYPDAKTLQILADGGGSNSCTARAWKFNLQHRLCNRHGLCR